MLLLVGLGNPGGQYAGNRHNIGFMALDRIQERHGTAPWRSRFQGHAADAVIGGAKALLLKPTTYMNDSGRAVGEALRFLKLPLTALVVFHDELDLPPARVRVKTGGGNAGHNGLRSITHLCGNEYRRVRLGIGHPGAKEQVHGYVLSDFAKVERPWVAELCDSLAARAPLLAEGKDAVYQGDVSADMTARGFGDVKLVGTKDG